MVGAAASVASMRCACLCALGVNVHRDAWMQRGGRTEGRGCGGVRRFDVLGRCGRARERVGGPTVWRMWGGGRSFSRRSVKRLVGQPIQVETAGCFVPAVGVIVRRPVCARFRNPVLCGGIETSAKLDYDRQGIGVAREVDEVAKLIYIHVHCPTTLEVPLRLQAHEGGGGLIFEAEG